MSILPERWFTKIGEAFRERLQAKGDYRPLSKAQHIVKICHGVSPHDYGIMWFGTILYVHLILKPAYAARGLPRSELLVGWICITIMHWRDTAYHLRIPTWWTLFHTRFGILLSIKVGLFIVMVISATFVTFVIGPRLKKKMTQTLIKTKRILGGWTAAIQWKGRTSSIYSL